MNTKTVIGISAGLLGSALILFGIAARITDTSFQSIKFIPASLLSTKKRLLIYW